MTIQDSLDKLKAGNKRFVASRIDGEYQFNTKTKLIVEEQNPYAAILSCADSRVVPEFVFDAGIGDLFVIKVAGNIANRSSIASIEFAVNQLNVNIIIILGHQNCGAVIATVQGGDNGENLNHLLAHISPAISACDKDASINEIVMKNAELTAADLKNNSQILKESIANGDLKIVPAYYNLDTGRVDFI